MRVELCFKDVEGKPPAQIDTDLDTHRESRPEPIRGKRV